MRIPFIFFLFWYSILSASAQPAARDEVIRTEKERFAAMVRKDIPALEKLLSDDLYYIHSNGSVDTKESFINSIKTGERYYDNIEIEDILVRIYGNTGIINGVCTYYRTDASNLKLRYTNVYVKDKRAGWQMVSWQSFKME
jgi:ketosteroid isomerase-like protein